MGSFKLARVEELPNWLADDEVGRPYQEVLGTAQDAELRKLKDAVLATVAPTAPDDALPFLEQDLLIELAPGESNDAYRIRAQQAVDITYWWGTKKAYQDILEPLGVAPADVDVFVDFETVAPGSWWSRVWLFVDSRFGPWAWDGQWGDGSPTWGDGGTWGSTVTVADIEYFRRMVRKSKSPGAYPTHMFVDLAEEGDGLWGSPGTWGDGGAWVNEGLTYYVRFVLGHVWGEEEAYVACAGTDGTWGDEGTWESFE